jgi:hypothetical protein
MQLLMKSVEVDGRREMWSGGAKTNKTFSNNCVAGRSAAV